MQTAYRKKIFKKAAGVAAGATLLMIAPSTAASDQSPTASNDGQAALSRLLEGRIAGAPQDCVRLARGTSLYKFEGVGLAYKMGRTVYVNVPYNSEDVDESDSFKKPRSFGYSYYKTRDEVCHKDLMMTIDRHGERLTGYLVLNRFVPYYQSDS